MKTFRAVWIIIIALFIIVIATPISAQTQADAPDYRITIGSNAWAVSADGTQIVINVSILNHGGSATQSTQVELVNLSNGDVVASSPLVPLNADASQNVSLSFPIETYPANSEQIFWVRVGIDDIEASDSRTIFDNQVAVPIRIPDYEVESAPVTTTNQQTDPSGTAGGVNDSSIITIPLIDVEFDPSNRNDVLLAIAILACSVVILWLIFTIFRVLFKRHPAFGNMQPPYATVPPMDPNSPSGRRQLWQPHAQHNLVPERCAEGQYHARKVLLGMDGYHLSGWRIKALRMTQYDMYGRVSRSEVLGASNDIRRLNRIAKRADKWEHKKIARRIRPVAKRLAKRINKKIYKRSASLPIALDLRLQGTHGEVRIMFELYQCQMGRIHQVDNWEPDMVMSGRYMYESYTFTLNGQSGDETVKMFRKRLPLDIVDVLTNMLMPAAVTSAPPITNTASRPVPVTPAPDTLSSTQPVQTNINTADTAERPQG